jgi:hypothetical protein
LSIKINQICVAFAMNLKRYSIPVDCELICPVLCKIKLFANSSVPVENVPVSLASC